MSYTTAEGRTFVDTNVLVYAYDASAGSRHLVARECVARGWADGAATSIQVLQELYVTLTQKLPNRVSIDAALVILDDISRWRTFSPSFRDVRGAIALQQAHGFSFWDAMIVRAALESACRTLVSNDMQDGLRLGALTIVNPFAGLAG